ncbi:hypothetical protein EDC39_10553 [Geothermobacter ehrlichii]|uniref:Uncharacterized protein n=1 Tax=Geothermobacter ehrlichii TaxID=213224 RepID=A0A5D3WKG6_9BACT|nr:DUF6178 family protein [Geothermobacter ehrlichii]TYO98691.1 hypothetical protein EDC39_10553 [Geothermobacter ehrlichii]
MTGKNETTRRVGHLALLRKPSRLTAKEYNALPFEERLALVQEASGKRKYDLIIDAADAPAIVERLPLQEIYLLARELGPEDMTELLALATPEQVTGLIDLDCWTQDRLNGKDALAWLAALAEAGDEQVLRVLTGMDFELLALMVGKWVRVTYTPDDIEDEEERKALIARDGGYGIEYRDSETAKQVGYLLNLLFRHDPAVYWRLMETVRGEPESALEEDVFRWRNGRLLDQGFPEPFEAQVIYAWLDPDRADPDAWRRTVPMAFDPEVRAPGYLLVRVTPKDLLAEVLAGGIDQETAWELTYLLNKMFVADGIDIGDARQVDAGLRRLYATLNLALESLAGQDVEKAAHLFNGCYLEYLFRHGHSLVLRLARRARALAASSIAPYIDAPYRALLDALCRRRPECWEGAIEAGRGGFRPFARLAELRQVEECLERLEGQRRLFEEVLPFELPPPDELDLDGCQIDDASQISLSVFFLTALANQLLGGDFLPLPLPAAELATLHGLISRDGELDPELRRRLVERFESELAGGGAFADWCLAVWDEEFCNIDPADLDPRFVGGILVRLSEPA